MLGRLRMTIPQCIAAYNEFASRIFEQNGSLGKVVPQGKTGYAYGSGIFEAATTAAVKQFTK